MFWIKGDEIFDFDLPFLSDLLGLLDKKLAQIDERIEISPDPDSYGLLDDAEYIVGLGFVACQRYIAATCRCEIEKSSALRLPPTRSNGRTIVELVNAGANAWKHSDEWGLHHRTSIARRTIDVIESAVPFKDYPTCNLLYSLTDSGRLTNLIPCLEQWRDNLVSEFRRRNPQQARAKPCTV